MKKVNEALNNPSSLTSGSRDGAPDPEGDDLIILFQYLNNLVIYVLGLIIIINNVDIITLGSSVDANITGGKYKSRTNSTTSIFTSTNSSKPIKVINKN